MRRSVARLAFSLLLAALTLGAAQVALAAGGRDSGTSTPPRPENVAPRQGSGSGARAPAGGWNQHDTAVYVVSTLNVVRTSRGNPLPSVLTRLHVTSYNVYADESTQNLFFIELVRSNGNVAGALAYQMGWFKPMSVSRLTDRLGVRKAPDDVIQAYKSDAKRLIGSFTSTLPN